jgi:hypothetical protein
MSATAPKRRWFRFSLRTLLFGATALGCWLGYEVNWILKRHQFLAEQEAIRRTGDPAWIAAIDQHAPIIVRGPGPGLSWLFGEKGALIIQVYLEPTDITWSRTEPVSESDPKVKHARMLFPESIIKVVCLEPPASWVFNPES